MHEQHEYWFRIHGVIQWPTFESSSEPLSDRGFDSHYRAHRLQNGKLRTMLPTHLIEKQRDNLKNGTNDGLLRSAVVGWQHPRRQSSSFSWHSQTRMEAVNCQFLHEWEDEEPRSSVL